MTPGRVAPGTLRPLATVPATASGRECARPRVALEGGDLSWSEDVLRSSSGWPAEMQGCIPVGGSARGPAP